jgi:hypothetical protein
MLSQSKKRNPLKMQMEKRKSQLRRKMKKKSQPIPRVTTSFLQVVLFSVHLPVKTHQWRRNPNLRRRSQPRPKLREPRKPRKRWRLKRRRRLRPRKRLS